MVEPFSSFRRDIKHPTSHSIFLPSFPTAASKKSRSSVHPVHRGNRKRNDDLSNIQSFVQVKKWASSQNRLHLGPCEAACRLEDHRGFTEIIFSQNGYGELKLDFSDSGKIHYKHTSIILYDANYVVVFCPKQGTTCKFYLAKGEFDTPCNPW